MTDKTLDQLIYGYDACGSPVADLLRELREARTRIVELERDLAAAREALLAVAECPNITGLGPRGIARAYLDAARNAWKGET